jgi:AcrR family transcriptional regulator
MSPRRKLTEERRVQILEAAARVIVRRGLADARIADVAEAAGTSPGLILYYFASKDRLLAEALTIAEERFYEELVPELERIDGAPERLVRLIELTCTDDSRTGGLGLDEYLLWLDLWARSPRDPVVATKRQSLDERWRAAISDIVRLGKAQGAFADVDPEDFSLRLAAMMDGLAIQAVLHDPDVGMERMRDLLLRTAGLELGFDLPSRPTSTGRLRDRKARAIPAS